MSRDTLLSLIEAHERIEAQLEQSRRSVWRAFAETEPALAQEVLRLFSNADAAAHWLTARSRRLGHSPARDAAEGRTAELSARVLRAMHGLMA